MSTSYSFNKAVPLSFFKEHGFEYSENCLVLKIDPILKTELYKMLIDFNYDSEEAFEEAHSIENTTQYLPAIVNKNQSISGVTRYGGNTWIMCYLYHLLKSKGYEVSSEYDWMEEMYAEMEKEIQEGINADELWREYKKNPELFDTDFLP